MSWQPHGPAVPGPPGGEGRRDRLPATTTTTPLHHSVGRAHEVRVRVDSVSPSRAAGDKDYLPLASGDRHHASSQHDSGAEDNGNPHQEGDGNDDDAASCSSHTEPHFGSAEVIRDIIVGLSDGLTVPFALAAGLAALNNSRLVVTAGLAEIVAGSISMGVGGYLAGMSEIEHYNSEREREAMEVELLPEREMQEIRDIFEPYGMDRAALEPLLDALTHNKEAWIDFMMKFELNMEKPDANRAWISAVTIGVSYLLGGMVPLIPYMLISSAFVALWASVAATVGALFLFGYIKARLFGTPNPLMSAVQMAGVGSLAAGAAFGIARLIPPAF
jgi:VIT1/CCC1 family predicted Fe2+/Mn2+ transporter